MKRPFLFLIVIATLMSTVTFAQQGTKQATIDEWLKEYKYYARGVRGIRSMNDGLHYSSVAGRGSAIVKSSYKSGNVVDTLCKLSWIKEVEINGISNYEFSADESQILLVTDQEAIYRRSFTASYYIYDIKGKTTKALSENGRQQLATFSPDGSKVAFVRENNIFYVDLAKGKEMQVTTDGKFNHIINGAPDWVYEEEFEFNQAFHWSPDGSTIAYIKFNETNVKEFGMTMFAGTNPTIEENKLYPENRVWKYPKCGEDNSVVSVHAYNLANKKTQSINLGTETDIYIPRLRWTQDASKLCVFRLNRLQNKLELLFANPADGTTKVIYTEENKYYIDESYFDDLQFLDDKKHFVMMSEKDGYAHLYLMDLAGNQVSQITKGNWDVTEFIGYDSRKKTFYYQSAEASPILRDVYSIKLNGKNKKKLSTQSGTNSASFSSSYKYYINNFSSSNTPTLVTLHNAKGKLIRSLQSNDYLKKTLAEYQFNYAEFFTFKTSEGVELNASIVKPANFDETKKYPVLMTQYSGPNSQEVLNRWGFGWEQVLAAKGYIVVSVDGRGTGARGEEFRKMTYMQLGKYETIDQIEAAKYLQTLNFIDPDRIGIWGWSFGGFISTLCMEKGNGIFKAGIAVAPVTNWRFYDNIYTERFMRTPQENPDGYDDNSPLFFADQLQGNYLICHGSADDNVHVQNTMEFIEKLVQANKQFDMMIYTNRNHSIYGGNTRYHLYTKKTNYLLENL